MRGYGQGAACSNALAESLWMTDTAGYENVAPSAIKDPNFLQSEMKYMRHKWHAAGKDRMQGILS